MVEAIKALAAGSNIPASGDERYSQGTSFYPKRQISKLSINCSVPYEGDSLSKPVSVLADVDIFCGLHQIFLRMLVTLRRHIL